MLEAIVGVAVRAIFASVLLGGVLSVLVLVATRVLALTAATRHALWTMALIATAVMPLAGIGVSIWKATAPHTAAGPAPTGMTAHSPPAAANDSAASSPNTSNAPNAPNASHAADRANGATATKAMRGSLASTRQRPVPPVTADAGAAPAPSLVDRMRFAERFAFARWTPRMSRNLALGVVAVWALGALGGLLGLAGSIVRVRGLKRRSSPLDGTLADELPWLTEVGPGREIYLRLSYETETPVAIGFRRPVILIPTELATADGLAAIEQLILHEYAHLRRHDDWTNLVQRAIERVFWFNPVVWLVGRRIALEREIASDDAVVEKTGEAHAYATSLWKLAREMRMPEHAVVAPGALLTRKQIAVRIEQLLDKKRARLHRSPAAALGVVLASALAVAFVASSAPAVELPAAAPESSTASTASTAPVTAWHAERAKKRDAAHFTTSANPSTATIAKPSTNAIMKPSTTAIAKPSAVTAQSPAASFARPSDAAAKAAFKPAAAAKTRVVNADLRSITYHVSSKGVTATITAAEKSPAKSASAGERVVTVYVHDTPAPGAREPAPAPHAMPAFPALPAAPPMPFVPAMPSMKPGAFDSAHLAKLSDAKVRAQQMNLRIQLQKVTGTVGPEVTRALHEAIATIPREIAFEEQGSAPGTRRARLDGVKLSRELIASCVGCSFRNADVRGVDLHGLRISADNFAGADMRGANLSGAKLTGVSLRGANLANADLRNAELAGVELRGAIFDGVQFEGIKLVGVSFQGVSLRGTALRSVVANCTGCDFSRMDLHGQDLHGISLSGADLAHSDLHDANLSGVRFSGVNLSGANLTGVDFTNARLDGCDLAGAELRGARTTGMTMSGTSGLDG
jgi:uncharacterized protein YjbI with pentapeptide repeats/beta-lactamase regulating signal transducer with metallopeptidase domain